MRRMLAALVVAVGLVAGVATPAPANAATLPVPTNITTRVLDSLLNPYLVPDGAFLVNGFYYCKPNATHPYPVLLVHGTAEDMWDNFGAVAATLWNNGYCVYAYNYGAGSASPFQGLGDIPSSANALASAVDYVRWRTGASKIDIVGHSQGGMLPRYYVNFLGGAPKVHSIVAFSPSSHGTTVLGINKILNAIPQAKDVIMALCTSCVQQILPSSFNAKMASVPDTVAGINYTVLSTPYDEVVTPWQTQFLSGSNATNINVTTGCSIDKAEHAAISYDPRALDYMLNALDPAHPRTPRCVAVTPIVGP